MPVQIHQKSSISMQSAPDSTPAFAQHPVPPAALSSVGFSPFSQDAIQQRISELTGRPLSPQPLNQTGIPDAIKQEFESRSGLSFDDVRVHYHSDKPAAFHAFAYTQGNHVYIRSGQEQHLRHELGHVVQQKQGLVSPTLFLHGQPVNADRTLEDNASRGVIFPHTTQAANEPAIQFAPTKELEAFLEFYKKTIAGLLIQPSKTFEFSAPGSEKKISAKERTAMIQMMKSSGNSGNRKATRLPESPPTSRPDDFMQSSPDKIRLLQHIFLGTNAESGEYTPESVGIHAYLDAFNPKQSNAVLPPDVQPIGFVGDLNKVHIMVWRRLLPDKNGALTRPSPKLKASTMLPVGMPMKIAAEFFLNEDNVRNNNVKKVGDTKYPNVKSNDLADFAKSLDIDPTTDEKKLESMIDELLTNPKTFFPEPDRQAQSLSSGHPMPINIDLFLQYLSKVSSQQGKKKKK